jgi:hypothetical protein
MWLLKARMRFTFPEPVILKRFLAPLCDFIFGIAIPFMSIPRLETRIVIFVPLPRSPAPRFLAFRLLRREDHRHELSFELGIALDLRDVRELLSNPIHHLTS